MKIDQPILVCGLARCGTSLMMRMLDIAGVPVFADNRSAYEADALNGDSHIGDLLPSLCGRASKVLDPHRHRGWPDRLDAKVIWLDRDKREQAKSIVKFTSTVGEFTIPGQAWRSIAQSLVEDTPVCLQLFAEMGCDVLRLRFDDLIWEPVRSATLVAAFLDLDHHTIKPMAAEVISRLPRCAPDMSIEMAAMEREAAPHAH